MLNKKSRLWSENGNREHEEDQELEIKRAQARTQKPGPEAQPTVN